MLWRKCWTKIKSHEVVAGRVAILDGAFRESLGVEERKNLKKMREPAMDMSGKRWGSWGKLREQQAQRP